MTPPKYVKFDKISLKNHPELNEKWLHQRIIDDPSILGLGDVVVRDKERSQPQGGRLDLLLQDQELTRRYEVEIQLGRTDESHIIRTIEYWDVERKRYPQYDHTAVIVAEDITSRFLNVISLFNGFIPLVAIQLNALKFQEQVSLVATTVLDQMTLGLVEEDEEQEVTDRAYWEKKGTKRTLQIADAVLRLIQEFEPSCQLNYVKHYIGLQVNGQSNNFAAFRPQKKSLLMWIRAKKNDEFDALLGDSELDLLEYDKWGRYRVRLAPSDVAENEELLRTVLRRAYDEAIGKG